MDNLLGKGAFRVDRSRALDKLMHFQLSDPSLFPIPLVRCAVAGGAAFIRLGFSNGLEGVVEAEFDGETFTSEELADPYSCLLDERGSEFRRHRELATALLTALRFNPKSLTVASGAGGARSLLTVRSLKDDSIAPAPSEETLTRVRVVLPFISRYSQNWRALPVGQILMRCRGIPLELRFYGGEPVHPGRDEPAFGGELSFDTGRVRGRLRPAARPDQPSALDFYSLGVEVARTRHSFPDLQVEGWLNDDGFSLNASQSGVVHNERFDAALKAVTHHIDKLVVSAVEYFSAARAGIAQSLLSGGRPLSIWNDRLSRGADAEKLGLFAELAGWVKKAKGPDPVPEVLAAARTLAWLRGAAERLLKGNSIPQKPSTLQRALWEAPLFFSTEMHSLSLSALKEQRDRIGYVPVSNEAFPGRFWPLQIGWTPGPADHALLKTFFKDEVREVGSALLAIARGKGAWQEASGLALLKPADVLLADKLEIPGLTGEIGFLAQPAASARIYLYYGDLPCGFVDHPCGLRFTAVVQADGEAKVRERLPLLEQAAVRLCRSMVLNPERMDLRILPHVVDFIEYAQARGELDEDTHAWVQSASIFRRQQSGLSLKDLRLMLDGGQSFYLCSLKSAPPGLADRTVLVPPTLRRERLDLFFSGYRLLEAAGLKKTWLAFKPSARRAAAPFEGTDPETLIAILEQLGSLHDQPEHPARAYVLASVRHFEGPGGPPRPSPDKVRADRRAHLGELLRNLPLFPGSGGGVTLAEVSRRLTTKGLTYAESTADAKRLNADLALSPDEAELLRSMFPHKGRALRKAVAPPIKQPRAKEPPPPPSVPPKFPYPGPVLFRRRWGVAGLDAQIALPARFGRPTLTVARDGRPAPAPRLAAKLLWVGSIWIDATGHGEKDLPTIDALQHLLGLFYRNFMESRFPKLRGRERENGVRYLLALMVQDKKFPPPPAGWRQLMADLRRVPLFRTVAGAPVSLYDLADMKGEAGGIRFLKADGRPLPPGLENVPVLSHLDLVKQLIPASLARIRPDHLEDLAKKKIRAENNRAAAAPPSPPPPSAVPAESRRPPSVAVSAPIPPPPPPAPAPLEETDPISRARRIVEAIGRRGVLLPESNCFEDGPQLRGILNSGLTAAENAAYLASLAASAQNRRHAAFSDSEEVWFQQALAHELAGPKPK